MRRRLIQDFIVIVLSIGAALLLVELGVIEKIPLWGNAFLVSLLAGFFFTSAFTIAPASAILGVLSLTHSPWLVAFGGACGAVLGDLVIFSFVRDRFADDLLHLIGPSRKKMKEVLHMRLFHWLTPFAGALIIASPLPDELGLFLLGVSKTKTHVLVPVAFTMNYLGVLLVALVAGAL